MKNYEGIEMTLPMIAARGIVAFPGVQMNIEVGRPKSKKAIDIAMDRGKLVCLVAQKNIFDDDPEWKDLYKVGVFAVIKQLSKSGDGIYSVIVLPVARCKILNYEEKGNYTVCTFSYTEKIDNTQNAKTIALASYLKDVVKNYIKFIPKFPDDLKFLIENVSDLNMLTDLVASNIITSFEDKQSLLEIFSPSRRAEKEIYILSREQDVAAEEDKIRRKVREQLDKNQRDYYLREQLKVISSELGEDKDNGNDEVNEYYEKIMALNISDESKEKLEKDIKKLAKSPFGSPESSVLTSYLDTILEVPFGKKTKDRMNIENVQKILDKDHDGLDDVKKRIIEYIAALKLNPNLKNQIICLVGPPGTGKTSVASSIARALNRKFVRISLGGIRDEADIRGHRKTYVGAMPGRIVSAMIQAGTQNPVILMDEVDKLTNDMHGDPSAALLEVLDTEQNKSFRDHYMEIPIDFSDCLFITTANTTYTIPPALLDRMEVIEMKIYTRPEKLSIAKRHLVPKQMKRHGLTTKNFKINDEAILELIDSYTREAGVRNLERYIAKCCRRGAKQISCSELETVKITKSNISEYADPSKLIKDQILDYDEVGTICGMAYTELGGEIMMIEALTYDGQGKMDLTGSLGEVMKESAFNALSYVKSHADELGINRELFKIKDLHINYPETAVPKDGPSAGVATAIAMVSEFTNIKVKRDVAVTGEITLRGRVLPIGGLREKTMAAYLAGVKTILIPKANIIDEDEIVDEVKKNVKIIYVSDVKEAIENALVESPYDNAKNMQNLEIPNVNTQRNVVAIQ